MKIVNKNITQLLNENGLFDRKNKTSLLNYLNTINNFEIEVKNIRTNREGDYYCKN